jgi:ketosteroid isomerase-like protein
MGNENVELVRHLYEAYTQGDMATMLESVDPDLEWTYLDPSELDPAPRVCRGRNELATALERQADAGLKSEVEEVAGNGARVMVVTHTPGIDALRVRQADDRNFLVITVEDGRITALNACRDRDEAVALAGVE